MEMKLTKQAQRKMIGHSLEMLDKMCPDWVVYAEPLESFLKAEHENEVAAAAAAERRGRPQLVK